ncbi:uncharacterized protein N7498_002967 [Penicillium cinerascens]|uniref:Major facilitator superfamily (MFS) profile domain-containing protein n=1 Tax=Penicillium cinerascens TaxID=70096 RepID=A0A9W9TCG2_9EURO|nr:uncharacterized protein N7498_002967 [Penicillium cinerascens]KAJ5216560.1 hypothetical protein N7498_002967 [Penicillium cinerascens]
MVPILNRILEGYGELDRDPQFYVSAVLAVHGLVSLFASPVIGHYSDKSPRKKLQLLLSLGGCLVGTALTAASRTLWVMFVGRCFQAVAGSGVWVVGLATVAEAVGEEHVGKTMGVVMSFTSAGMLSGPMISGLLFQNVGHWAAWTVPFALLMVDLIARLVMLDPETPDRSSLGSSHLSSAIAQALSIETDETDEADETPPLQDPERLFKSSSSDISDKGVQDFASLRAFYGFLLTDRHVLTALLITTISGSVMTSFDTTLPLHVEETFGWGPSYTGLMFFCLEIGMVIGPVSGWIRDRFGVRNPAVLGMIAFALLIWLLGVPGNASFPWASPDTRGSTIYIFALIGIGAVSPFLSGIATFEVIAVVKQHQAENPNIFGPHGGLARALSMTDVAATVAMMAGPIISGTLHMTVGYYYMNLIFAFIFLFLSLLTLGSLRNTHPNPSSPQL